MAALEVRRAGFPTRVLYKDFVRDFRVFTPRDRATDDQDLTEKMLASVGLSGCLNQTSVLFDTPRAHPVVWAGCRVVSSTTGPPVLKHKLSTC